MSKVHTKVNNVNSLCGKTPDKATVVSNSEFFETPLSDRCYKCSVEMRKKGYKLDLPPNTLSRTTRVKPLKKRIFGTHLMYSYPD